jgi:hypothetical protein
VLTRMLSLCLAGSLNIRSLLASALVGDRQSAPRSGRFNPGHTALCVYWAGSWKDPRAGLHDVKEGS